VLATLLAGPLLASCGERERTYDVTEIRERDRAEAPADPGLSTGERFGQAAPAAPGSSPAPAAGPRWAWDTPEGWQELPPQPLRIAGWRAGSHPEAECTLSEAGGALLDNVNRWRKQLGLDPTDASAVEALPKAPFVGQEAVLVDLTGHYRGMRDDKDIPQARMVGLMLARPQGSLFLKLVGPAEAVAGERGRFDRLTASIRPAPAAPPGVPGHGARPPAETAPGRVSFTLPEGWERRPSRPPREATLAPAGATDTELALSVLPGPAGGLLDNVNMWRGSMGLPPLAQEEVAALPRVPALGTEGVLVEIEGSYRASMGHGQGPIEDATLLGLLVIRDTTSVFVKMVGPSDRVRPEKERFQAFCRSLGE
jgi:hypothetical protein